MCLSKTGLKIFLLVINVVFFLCGGIVLGIGIWAVADKLYVAEIIGTTLFRSASYLMVVTGVIFFLISFLGCLGAISGKKLLVLIYMGLLVLVFILLLATAIVAAKFQDDIESNMQDRMSRTIREQYGYDIQYNEDNLRLTEAWDKAQSSLECCGVKDEGWFIYHGSRWFQQANNKNLGYGVLYNPNLNLEDEKFVPLSCCVYSQNLGSYLNQLNCQSYKYGPPRYMDPTAARNDAVYYIKKNGLKFMDGPCRIIFYGLMALIGNAKWFLVYLVACIFATLTLGHKGCYDAARRFIQRQSTMMLAIGFSFCVFLGTGIFITFMFFRKLSSGSEGRGDLGYR